MAEIEVVDEVSEADNDRIGAFLGEHGLALGFVWDKKPLGIFLREDGELVGGLTGEFVFRWLHIKRVSVASAFRGKGLGRKLMIEAERIAAERNCLGIWLETFSFQAPDFYKKLGYSVFGELEDFPPGETRSFLMKRLR